eukprot:1392459-Amorphochlora_amoeboformis.AAC.1
MSVGNTSTLPAEREVVAMKWEEAAMDGEVEEVSDKLRFRKHRSLDRSWILANRNLDWFIVA